MGLEEAIEGAQEELNLCEFVVRETIGNEYQCIAKSKLAMTGPWGCGSDKDISKAMRKAIVSLRQEMNHVKAERRGAKEIRHAPPKRRNDDLV